MRDIPSGSLPSRQAALPVAARWRFPLLLALVLTALLVLFQPKYAGDVVEYTAVTVALADHGSAEVRLEDIDRVRALLPGWFVEPFAALERGMRAGDQELYAAFVRGREGKVYAVHFFGYSLLAAAPFKLFEAIGVPPFKAFQAVNLAAIFVLGLALRRFFGSDKLAWTGLGLFMLCGGVLYWDWTSPECVSAAALLAALLLFCSRASLPACLLAGLACQQNPTIVFFFAFAPLLRLLIEWQPQAGLGANLRRQIDLKTVLAIAAGLALVALPPLFNLYQYGTPNIIARKFSDPALIGPVRLISFYFDLNQGMIVGAPGLIAGLLLWLRRSDVTVRGALLLALSMTLALALPALAIHNWNSGAKGVMRYAFWAAMPLLFVFLLLLRRAQRLPRRLLAGVLLVQLAAMAHATNYNYVSFSPLVKLILKVAPQLYHPEPEIFVERMGHNDDYIWPNQIYTYRVDGATVKTVVNHANARTDELLCGRGGVIDPAMARTESTRGWYYLDGPLRCISGSFIQHSFQLPDFRANDTLRLDSGWHTPEANGPNWDGVWSIGAKSRLVVRIDGALPESLLLVGNYLEPNRRSRVKVNGVDLGWHELDREGALPLPPPARGNDLLIELEHESPRQPGGGDPRELAFFLREASLRQPSGQP